MAKLRQSNMELLRMIAMFMILVIHANMISLQRPTFTDLIANPLSVVSRYFIESFGIVGVNVFVLLSGWFLINTRSKSFLNLSFQILMLWGGAYLVFLLLGKTDLSVNNILEIFAFTRWDWFIKAYIVLMIIAPIINTYVKNSSEKQQRLILFGFFLFSSTYGWIGGADRFFVNGYGPLLFIGLYLLAQYVHNTINKKGTPFKLRNLFLMRKEKDLLIFGICVVLNTFLGVLGLWKNLDIYSKVYAYVNPITIVASLYLLLFFSKLDIHTNKCINTLAKGSFAVYLLHSQVDLRPLFNGAVQYLYNSYSSILCILIIFVFLILVYLVSVIVDWPRIWIWNMISKKYNIQ